MSKVAVFSTSSTTKQMAFSPVSAMFSRLSSSQPKQSNRCFDLINLLFLQAKLRISFFFDFSSTRVCSAALEKSALLLLGIGVLMAESTTSASSIVRDATLDSWLDASLSSRADILVVGDSVVMFGGHGWDAGITYGAENNMGVAGTGVISGSNVGQGEGYRYTDVGSTSWSSSAASAFGDAALVNFGRVSTAENVTSTIGLLLSGSTVNPDTEHVLDFWATSGTGGSDYSLQKRLGEFPWTTSYSAPGFTLAETDQITHVSNDIPTSGEQTTNVRLSIDNASIVGMRLSEKNATGATVTSIGYGGKTTLDFYNDRWNNKSEMIRQTYLKQIVEGGSGKLLVPIFEGFNDRNENDPSVNGIVDADSPEAFQDNILSLINLMQSDWSNAGFIDDDLSFLVFGMYDIAGNNDELIEYSDIMRLTAESTDNISYIDIRSLGPDYASGDALGYYSDGLHLSRQGALYYGDQIMSIVASVTNGLDGDFNNDGSVDAADYTVWRDGLGGTYTLDDYDIWVDNFGITALSSTASTSSVPEASTLAMSIIIVMSINAFQRSRVIFG